LDYLYLDTEHGRGALPHLASLVGAGTQIRLVAERSGIDRAIETWKGLSPLATVLASPSDAGQSVLVELVADVDSAEGILVTVLTGGRPKLLHRTLKSLAKHDPRLVEEAMVMVMINGNDAASRKVAESFDWVDATTSTDEVLPVAEAVSELFGAADSAARCGDYSCEFVLHLEDDWECRGLGWRARAVSLLRSHPELGQVLVCAPGIHGAAAVNPVTGRRFSWESATSRAGVRYKVAPAAYSLRPSLIRGDLARLLWPSASEAEAMEQFQEEGGQVARLQESPFHHIGEGESLRAKLGR
jgi:hypothetical protein